MYVSHRRNLPVARTEEHILVARMPAYKKERRAYCAPQPTMRQMCRNVHNQMKKQPINKYCYDITLARELMNDVIKHDACGYNDKQTNHIINNVKISKVLCGTSKLLLPSLDVSQRGKSEHSTK